MKKEYIPRNIYTVFTVFQVVLIAGIDTSFSAYFVPQADDLNNLIQQESLIGSIGLFLRPIGSLFTDKLTRCLGKKFAIQTALVLYVMSWLLVVISPSITFLIIARGFCGFVSGMQKTSFLFLSEVCEKKNRSRLMTFRTSFNTIGITIPLLLNYFCHWKITAIFCVIVPLISLYQLRLIPESKYWYMRKGQKESAISSIKWFSPDITEEEIHIELMSIANSFYSISIQSMESSCHFNPVLLSSLLVIFQAGCGRLAMITHLQHFFSSFHISYDANTAVLLFGILNLLITNACILMMKEIENKSTLFKILLFLFFTLISIIIYDLILLKVNFVLPIFPMSFVCAYVFVLNYFLPICINLAIVEIMIESNEGKPISLVNSISTLAEAVYSFIAPSILQFIDINYVIMFAVLNIILIGFIGMCISKAAVNEINNKENQEEPLLLNDN